MTKGKTTMIQKRPLNRKSPQQLPALNLPIHDTKGTNQGGDLLFVYNSLTTIKHTICSRKARTIIPIVIKMYKICRPSHNVYRGNHEKAYLMLKSREGSFRQRCYHNYDEVSLSHSKEIHRRIQNL